MAAIVLPLLGVIILMLALDGELQEDGVSPFILASVIPTLKDPPEEVRRGSSGSRLACAALVTARDVEHLRSRRRRPPGAAESKGEGGRRCVS